MNMQKEEDKKQKNKQNDKQKPTLGILIGMVVVSLIFFFSILIVLSLRWLLSQWDSLTIEEILIQLFTSVGGTSKEMIFSYVLLCLLPALGLMAVIVITFIVLWRRKREKVKVFLAFLVIISIVIMFFTGIVAWRELKFEEFNTTEYSELVDKEYIAPDTVSISFNEKKNLVYIYLESMETTYADVENGGAFPYNCIPELCELARDNEDFSGPEVKLNGGHVLPGTGNTISAMVAHTSGIPMKIGGNNMNRLKDFFPQMTNLGDILEENGYTQELLIGSDAEFAGRRTFFTQHGNYSIVDYVYAKEKGWIDKDYNVWWGYEDEKLFSFAKSELLRLAEGDEPFNFTMLTVDTHFPDGYTCQLCKDEFPDNPYADVMACSSRQVSEFVHWIQEQDFYKDTVIVLMGDHTTMDDDFCDDVPESYDRCVYTAYINSAVEPVLKERRVYSTFDAFPTTLAAIGAEIKGNRLGLGTNLFSDTPTLCEKYGVETMDGELRKNSHIIDSLQQNYFYDEIDEHKGEIVVPENTYTENNDSLMSGFDFSTLEEWGLDTPDTLTIRIQEKKNGKTLTELSISPEESIEQRYQVASNYKTDREKGNVRVQLKRGDNERILEEWYIYTEGYRLPSGNCELHIDNLFRKNYIVSLTSMGKSEEAVSDSDFGEDTSAFSVDFNLEYKKDGGSVDCLATISKLNVGNLENMLRLLNDPDYAVFFSVSDEATRGLSAEAKELLHGLGLREDLTDKYRYSYCALICRGELQLEQLSENRLEYTGELPDGTKYRITSGGNIAGAESRIILNDIECSPNRRGLNIAVYNLSDGIIEARRNFDTFLLPGETE